MSSLLSQTMQNRDNYPATVLSARGALGRYRSSQGNAARLYRTAAARLRTRALRSILDQPISWLRRRRLMRAAACDPVCRALRQNSSWRCSLATRPIIRSFLRRAEVPVPVVVHLSPLDGRDRAVAQG